MTSLLDPDWPFVSLLADASEYFYCLWDPVAQKIALTWKNQAGECFRLSAVIDERTTKKREAKPANAEPISESIFDDFVAAVEKAGISGLQSVEKQRTTAHVTIHVALRVADGRTSRSCIPGGYSSDERTLEIPDLMRMCAPKLFPKIPEEKKRKRRPKVS